ncbi:hypothetical protein E1B28_013281 [Marasmius oreades]|uniref:Uncharacterized protein n=1 Tax=Marasmius oreades TaxID=181124 RepID=A0A9P7UMI7_9AGAR|nr:uncharacterized protein E1B28_013281 [Marasmius oreades]KAG7087303.1 hypothetical protein E1B28_013281 [Marasmius oreades]
MFHRSTFVFRFNVATACDEQLAPANLARQEASTLLLHFSGVQETRENLILVKTRKLKKQDIGHSQATAFEAVVSALLPFNLPCAGLGRKLWQSFWAVSTLQHTHSEVVR